MILYLDAFMKKATAVVELEEGAVLYFRIDNPIIEYQGELDKEGLEDRLLKEFKMSGLVLKDKEIVFGMDKEWKLHSAIVPVSTSAKDESGIKDTGTVLTKDEFQDLRNYVIEKIKNLGEQIVEGNIQAKPYKYKAATGCDYCKYKSICQVDTQAANEKYNDFSKFTSKESVLEEMKKILEKNR